MAEYVPCQIDPAVAPDVIYAFTPVGWCRLSVSKPVLKVPMLPAHDNLLSTLTFKFDLRRYTPEGSDQEAFDVDIKLCSVAGGLLRISARLDVETHCRTSIS
jgi:hypothetical protein